VPYKEESVYFIHRFEHRFQFLLGDFSSVHVAIDRQQRGRGAEGQRGRGAEGQRGRGIHYTK